MIDIRANERGQEKDLLFLKAVGYVKVTLYKVP